MNMVELCPLFMKPGVPGREYGQSFFEDVSGGRKDYHQVYTESRLEIIFLCLCKNLF